MNRHVPGSRTKVAFLDESLSDSESDPHVYLLAAAVCDESEVMFARDAISALKLKGQVKLHWHSESHKRRQLIAEAVAGLPLDYLVVARGGRPGERSERRRRHCLERMLYELDQLKVTTATFESRGPKDDQRDRNLLDALRGKKHISPDLRIAHVAGPSEAMLWVADAICGAVVRHRAGDASFLDAIRSEPHLRIIEISAP